MNKLQRLTNPESDDLIYAIDRDGGINGRPKTVVIEIGNLGGGMNQDDLIGAIESASNLQSIDEFVQVLVKGTVSEWNQLQSANDLETSLTYLAGTNETETITYSSPSLGFSIKETYFYTLVNGEYRYAGSKREVI